MPSKKGIVTKAGETPSKKGIVTTVTFYNTSSEVKHAMEALSKSALRASLKVIRKHLRENLPVRTKRFKNHVASWVRIDKKTGQPKADIGFYGWRTVQKKKKKPSHASPWWIEYGTAPHKIRAKSSKQQMVDKSRKMEFGFEVDHPGTKATHLLRNTVQDNIEEIRAAQVEYLAELSKAVDVALGKADPEDEYEESD